MWDLRIASPLGRISMRKLLLFVAALLVTIFAYLVIAAPTVSALEGEWQSGSIIYDGNTYRGPETAEDNNNLGLTAGVRYYTYVEGGNIHIIYFAPGADPPTATDAEYARFTVNGIGVTNGPFDQEDVTFTVTEESQREAGLTSSEQQESCRVDGVGWIICPVTTFLAEGMDWIFDILSGFLEVRPLETSSGSDNVMLNVWNIMRSVANVMFVIAFIIIVYSHLTSVGISNYGIKKMFPKLIIAAILVNISFWICAVAIDLSNIIGHGLQGIFIGLRDNVLQGSENGWNLVRWESVAGFVLSGGAAGAALAAGALGTISSLGAFSVVGVLLLLLPILVGALLTILVVLLIIAARQAIITILVILAPLAFVAYLLPNTEEWFNKWRSLFMTMLIFFPAFSLVFGGSQFAGLMIIQNAQDINVVILGMAVQIAPLAITPLLLQLSGSLLGRIAGIVNNPNKGLLDRVKNFSNERLEANKAAEMARTRKMAANGQLGKRHFFRRTALMMDNDKRLREGMKHVNEQDANSYFADSSTGRRLHEAEHVSSVVKETVENRVNAHLQDGINVTGSTLNILNANLEASKAQLGVSKSETDAQISEFKSGLVAHTGELGMAVAALKKSTIDGKVQEDRAASADREITANIATALKTDSSLRMVAGGVQGVSGAERALASAINAQSKAHGESIANARTIINAGNYDDNTIVDLAKNISGNTGITITDDIREAALEMIGGGKNADAVRTLLRDLDINALTSDQRQAFGDALLTSTARPKFVGAGVVSAIKQGQVKGDGKQRVDSWVASAINDDKLGSAQTLISQDKEHLESILSTIDSNTSGIALDPGKVSTIVEQLYIASTDHRFSGQVGERRTALRSIYSKLRNNPAIKDRLVDERGQRLPDEILKDT